MLLLSPQLIDLHLTHTGYYLDQSYDSMLWETITYIKEEYDIHHHLERKDFMKFTAKIYAALIPELHLEGVLPKEYLSADFDFIYENREKIDSAIDDFYLEILDDSIGKYGDWEDIGHFPARSMEWCKRHYDKEVIEEYQEYLQTWENLRSAMR